ncbi:hypothetical protein BCR36DRAFT_413421 [Piromyces finnis]|uniref:DUF7107 domain-containing protein n=1 Tax=Piromyces finnis TaxID=1754191 RepID=A0A1Y1V7L6_9FUNG|nr:hypothetical protein BCR36DRAFT_413421 [Piromyces finnis]|eukprot:ORX47893.1 hypothetical protein BCR36DRAFT_413421 [Piromyces finnis]
MLNKTILFSLCFIICIKLICAIPYERRDFYASLCNTDADCYFSICHNGYCVSDKPEGSECKKSKDCSNGQFCNDGKCKNQLTPGSPCKKDEQCMGTSEIFTGYCDANDRCLMEKDYSRDISFKKSPIMIILKTIFIIIPFCSLGFCLYLIYCYVYQECFNKFDDSGYTPVKETEPLPHPYNNFNNDNMSNDKEDMILQMLKLFNGLKNH